MPSPLTVKRNDYINHPKRSDIETPKPVCDFIAKLFPSVKVVLDPCKGSGNLLVPFTKHGCTTISYEIKDGQDFLEYTGELICDLVVCNPPFNLGVGKRLGSEIFLEKIVNVCGLYVPIVLFVPMGFRLNQRKISGRWKWLRDEMPDITTIISLPIDAFDDVLFHSEILIFNAPNLKPHYFLTDWECNAK